MTKEVTAIWHEIRYSVRVLRRNPGFAAGAVLTLALVIGANTAIFSGIYGLLFRRLPYRQSSRLVMLWDSNRKTGQEHITVMEGSFPILLSQAKSFEGMAAFIPARSRDAIFAPKLWGTEEPVAASACTSQLSPVLGVAPFLGRPFTASEDSEGPNGAHARVVILSYDFWKQHYGGNPNVIGKALTLNEFGEKQEYTIVGVMPEGFDFPYPLYPDKPDLWENLGYSIARFSRGNDLDVVARLKPSVTLQHAQADLDTVASRIRAEHPKEYGDESVSAVAVESELIRNVKTILWVLVCGVGVVLLIGCANIGNLLLVRAVAREKEMAVRRALGAGSIVLVRQMLTEALLLSIAGGALGLLLAYWSLRTFLTLLPSSLYIPRFEGVALDATVLAVNATVSALVAAAFSVFPSMRVCARDFNETLKSGRASSARGTSIFRRPGSILLISEVSLALVLVTGTFLMMKSLRTLLQTNVQFQPQHLLSVDMSFSNAAVSSQPNFDKLELVLYREFQEHISSIRGVRSVAFIDKFPPFTVRQDPNAFKADGGAGPIAETYEPAEMHVVTPNYFAMMEIRLLRGRLFADADMNDSLPVAVINEAMAKRYWPEGDPLGQKIAPFLRWTDRKVSYTIVGIVQEPKRFGSGEAPEPAVFLSYWQVPLNFVSVVVRTAGNPQSVAGTMHSAALQILPGQMFVGPVRTGEDYVSESSARSRFTTMLLSVFSGLALLLALVGVYGLISFYTLQRTHEIGIQMALGATPWDVLRLIFREGMTLAGLGVVFGLVVAYGFAKSFASLLYGVSVLDIGSFAGAAIVLLVVALAACWIPARRAMRVEPMEALRYE